MVSGTGEEVNFDFHYMFIFLCRQHRKRSVMLIDEAVACIIPISMSIPSIRKKRKFFSTRLRKRMKVRSECRKYLHSFWYYLVETEIVRSSSNKHYKNAKNYLKYFICKTLCCISLNVMLVSFTGILTVCVVLGDPHQRAIYDSLGTHGLETEGWEIVQRTKTPQEIREEYERLAR